MPANTHIRAAALSDLPALTRIYNHYVQTTSITFDVTPFSVEERAAWFSHYAQAGRYRLLVATVRGELAGYASSSQFRTKPAYATSVESSIYLDPGMRGAGLGKALYKALFDQLETEAVHRCFAGITLPNEASLALHRTFGFEDVGTMREAGYKFDRYWDVHWMQRGMRAPSSPD